MVILILRRIATCSERVLIHRTIRTQLSTGNLTMVMLAQLVELWIVIPAVMGSNPIRHTRRIRIMVVQRLAKPSLRNRFVGSSPTSSAISVSHWFNLVTYFLNSITHCKFVISIVYRGIHLYNLGGLHGYY